MDPVRSKESEISADSLNANRTSNGVDPETPLKQIRTFQGDVADALHKQNESIVSIHQMEVEKKRDEIIPPEVAQTPNKDRERRKDLLFLSLGSLFLIVAGVAGAWYGYNEFVRRSSPPDLSNPLNQFIAPNSEEYIDLSLATRESFASLFRAAIAGLPAGELRHVVGKNGGEEISLLTSTRELLEILESRAPGSLVRSFSPLFMIGAFGQSPFIIIRLESFENAFPGMLSWEAAMAEDLVPLFGNTKALKAIEPTSVFKDVIVRNKDVRILSSGTGTSSKPAILYSFFDNRELIITDRIETLQILIDRLTREKLVR